MPRSAAARSRGLSRGKFLVGLDETREGARGFYDLAVPRKSSTRTPWTGICPCCRRSACPFIKIFNWLPERPEISAEVKRKWPGHLLSIRNPQSAIRN